MVSLSVQIELYSKERRQFSRIRNSQRNCGWKSPAQLSISRIAHLQNLSKEKPRMRHGMARSQIYHISGFSVALFTSMYQRILEGSWISTLENVGWSAMEGQINGEHGMRKNKMLLFLGMSYSMNSQFSMKM